MHAGAFTLNAVLPRSEKEDSSGAGGAQLKSRAPVVQQQSRNLFSVVRFLFRVRV